MGSMVFRSPFSDFSGETVISRADKDMLAIVAAIRPQPRVSPGGQIFQDLLDSLSPSQLMGTQLDRSVEVLFIVFESGEFKK